MAKVRIAAKKEQIRSVKMTFSFNFRFTILGLEEDQKCINEIALETDVQILHKFSQNQQFTCTDLTFTKVMKIGKLDQIAKIEHFWKCQYPKASKNSRKCD